MKVDIYRNLRRDCWSVRSREQSNYGDVIAHTKYAIVNDVTFVVSEAGRQRVLREKRKNVHAFVRGELDALNFAGNTKRLHKLKKSDYLVSYSPYKGPKFTSDTTNEPIEHAETVLLAGKSVYARRSHGKK